MQKQDETSNTNNFSTHFLHTLRIPVILGKSKDLKLAKCSSHGIPWHLGPKSEFRNAYDDVTWWQRQCWSVCFTWISVKHLKKTMIWIWLCICVLFEDLFIFSRRLQGSASRHFIIVIGELTSTHINSPAEVTCCRPQQLPSSLPAKYHGYQKGKAAEQQLPRVLGVPHFDPFSTLPWGYPIPG